MPVFNSPRTAHGRGRPEAPPAWMAARTVDSFYQLPDSVVPTTITNPESYTGMVLDDMLNVRFLAGGGHSNGTNNGVAKYALGVDSPSGWVAERAATAASPSGAAYLPDGRPNTRHGYESYQYDPDTRRVIMIGLYAAGDTTNGHNPIDGFNTVTGDWDAAGTYPFSNELTVPGEDANNHGSVRDPNTGNLFFRRGNTVYQWKPGQSTKTDRGTTAIGMVRFPNCWDSDRNAIFGMAWGDGQGSNSGLTCVHTADPSSGSPVKRTITLAGTGLAALEAGTPQYGAMDYDPVRKKFVFMHGGSAGGAEGAPKFYEITPNTGTEWDVVARTFSGSVGNVGGTGAVGKLKYIRRGGIGGFLLYTNALYFLRTI